MAATCTVARSSVSVERPTAAAPAAEAPAGRAAAGVAGLPDTAGAPLAAVKPACDGTPALTAASRADAVGPASPLADKAAGPAWPLAGAEASHENSEASAPLFETSHAIAYSSASRGGAPALHAPAGAGGGDAPAAASHAANSSSPASGGAAAAAAVCAAAAAKADTLKESAWPLGTT